MQSACACMQDLCIYICIYILILIYVHAFMPMAVAALTLPLLRCRSADTSTETASPASRPVPSAIYQLFPICKSLKPSVCHALAHPQAVQRALQDTEEVYFWAVVPEHSVAPACFNLASLQLHYCEGFSGFLAAAYLPLCSTMFAFETFVTPVSHPLHHPSRHI